MSVKTLETLNPADLPAGISAVKLFTPWCGPCKVLGKTFPTIEGANLFEVNADSDMDAMVNHNVRTVPTTLIFKDGELKAKVSGNDLPGIQAAINSLN